MSTPIPVCKKIPVQIMEAKYTCLTRACHWKYKTPRARSTDRPTHSFTNVRHPSPLESVGYVICITA